VKEEQGRPARQRAAQRGERWLSRCNETCCQYMRYREQGSKGARERVVGQLQTVLKRQKFTRAVKTAKQTWASAPEGKFLELNPLPATRKPGTLGSNSARWRARKRPHRYCQKENMVPGPVTGWHPPAGRGVVLPRARGIKRLYYVQFAKSSTHGRAWKRSTR
jgi:hypothetical protein